MSAASQARAVHALVRNRARWHGLDPRQAGAIATAAANAVRADEREAIRVLHDAEVLILRRCRKGARHAYPIEEDAELLEPELIPPRRQNVYLVLFGAATLLVLLGRLLGVIA